MSVTRTATVNTSRGNALDVARVRADFPALHQQVNGRPLVYLDNAATTQKPQAVLDALLGFYSRDCANVHRGVHALSQRATDAYEGARETVARFLNARPREIVFTRGTTEAINLVAYSYGSRLSPGDEILITELEHHSNIVPWQMLAERTGARLRVAPIDDRGEIILEEFQRLLGPRTRIVAVAHVSNALGTVNPVEEICRLAHTYGARVLVDGAQAVPHQAVDVRALDCDFYAFSGHKIYGPTGIGVLFGRWELLEAMPPYQGGGDMIRSVTFEKTLYNDPPYRFEAGTPHIAGAIGLAAAIEYVTRLGLEEIRRHEQQLLEAATRALEEIPGVRIVGTAAHKAAVVSFVLDGVHPHDVATVLDHEGVAVRAGHHCAQPLMERFGLPATTRASFALYNTLEEVDALAQAVRRARELFD
jgi:cysteine desulfurase/selenocysteine lyase